MSRRAALLLVTGIASACSGSPAPNATDPASDRGSTSDAAVYEPGPAPDVAAADAAPAPPAGPKPTLELAFAGDVMFGRYIDKGFRPIPADMHDVFAAVAPLLDTDYTLVNLETPILRTPPRTSPYGSRMRFVATPSRVASLRAAHIDAVTLANNHAFDMHREGIVETPQVLDELGIHYIGANRDARPVLRAEDVEVGGWRIAFIAASTVWNGMTPAANLPYVQAKDLKTSLVPVVRAARADHDLVIVVLHWGTEYAIAPSPWQVKAAHALIDAGADAVIAHHPHVVQGLERYKAGVIAYSLGNFLFDNLWDDRGWEGILRLTYRLDGHCLASVRYLPTSGTRPYYAPVPAHGKRFAAIAAQVQKRSSGRAIRTAWRIDGDHLAVDGACP